MIEFLDQTPDSNVLESEYVRLLGYPENYDVDGRAKELMDAARQWYRENGKPWVYVRQLDSFELKGDSFLIDGKEFSSRRIHAQMREAQGHSVVAAVASAGKNCEERAHQLWKAQKPDEYFFMEVYGSAVVEHLIANAAGQICSWADRHSAVALPRYSPGYPEWDIREQQKLYDVIVQNKKYMFPEEIHVLHTGMLHPKKSLLTLFGLTNHLESARHSANLNPCKNCSLQNCQYRRGAYKQSPAKIEDAGAMRSNGKSVRRSPLIPNAQYSFNTKALEKWSKERLHLQFNADGCIDALFRYEGTTCSNMGHALEFEYHITIESSQNDYAIQHAACSPAPGDGGYTFMCQYIENPDSLMTEIANEKPLFGKPLNDVLSWRRDYHPSACYCRPAGREYKWGLVYEVLHYALVQHEKEKIHRIETKEDRQPISKGNNDDKTLRHQ